MTKDDGSELGRGMLDEFAQGQAKERERVLAQAAEVWDNERRAGTRPEELIADAVDWLGQLAEDASSDYGPDQRLTNRTRDTYALHVPALLSMVKRLERENAALRQALKDVLADVLRNGPENLMLYEHIPGQDFYGCVVSGAALNKARELLVGETAAKKEGEGG